MNIQPLYQVLDKTNAIALATSVDNKPNVRIVNFCYAPERSGVLYFATDRENQKVKEFIKNPYIAFTTVPVHGESIPHARSSQSIVQKSRKTLAEVQNLFIAKIPGYKETIAAIGESLDVFEIHIKQAIAVLDFDTVEIINFDGFDDMIGNSYK